MARRGKKIGEQLVVVACDAHGAKPLAEVKFEVRGGPLSTPVPTVTDAEGRATVSLEPGHYDVVSTAPPANYAPTSVPTRTVEVKTGEPLTVEFSFARLACLRVEVVSCVEGSTPRPIPKATVVVRRSTGAEPSQSGPTGDDGSVSFSLAADTYWVEHRLPPTGYRPGPIQGKEVTLAAGATETIQFVDVALGTLVVRVRGDDDKAVVGASILVCRDGQPERQVKTGDDGSVGVELSAGRYEARYLEAPAGYLLADAPSHSVVVGPGDAATAEFRSPRAATLTIKARRADAASTSVAGGSYTIARTNQPSTPARTVVTGADGTAVVDGLAAGTYTVAETTAPAGHILADKTVMEKPVDLPAGGAQTLTLAYASSPAPTRTWGKGGGASWAIVAVLVVFAGWAARLRNWDVLTALMVLAVGLGLLAGIGGRGPGFFRALIGEDNRVSTSKTQLGIWTLAVAWVLALLTAHAVFHQPTQRERTSCGDGTPKAPDNNLTIPERVQCALPESRWSDYLILLGGPFAAAVLAKGFVSWRVNNGSLQKTIAPEHKTEVAEVIKDDQDRTDLVDSQYLLFNVVALAYFAAALVRRPELPEMPPVLLAMTSGAAALYAANKAVASNKPVITGVAPATIRPGERVTISGQFFVLRTTPAQPVTVNLEGFGPLRVDGTPTAATVTAVVPPGVPAGQRNLTVTTSTGVTTEGWPVQVGADQPQILGVQESEAVPGAALHLFGRRFRSALETTATNATVWFGPQMVLGELAAPTASGLDTVTVTVPITLSGAQVSIQVQSTQGLRSDPVTVALLAAPRVVSIDAKAVGEAKVSVQARVRGFTDPTGQRTATNQVQVDKAPVDFAVVRQGDRIDLITFEAARPQGSSTLTVELRDHQGRSTGPLSTPIVVESA